MSGALPTVRATLASIPRSSHTPSSTFSPRPSLASGSCSLTMRCRSRSANIIPIVYANTLPAPSPSRAFGLTAWARRAVSLLVKMTTVRERKAPSRQARGRILCIVPPKDVKHWSRMKMCMMVAVVGCG